jgi:phosphoribosylformylglycinamidine (FGAM) synthase-like enzyme
MAFSGALGLSLDIDAMPAESELSLVARLFAEDSARYLLEVRTADLAALSKALGDVPHAVVGSFNASGELTVAGASAKVADLGQAWSGGLAW